ncbi:MarR family winged helix-turn-helix transcriptional regulator [Microbacterium sp. HMH0099]|uniref:MarR family winged helix-turn-helix transcriptional regulator n=1 Tax=Microbacterium sp. HMH0099 TaxID=3414026 RepID=UPI003BF61F4C
MTAETSETSPLMAALMLFCRERAIAAAQARKELEVNELDAKAILYIATHAGARPSELAGHLRVTSAGVTTMVERLVRRGILRREADEADRRVSHIHLAVPLDEEPWSQLTRFHDAFRAVVSQLDPEVERELAAFLTHATLTARDEIDRSATGATSAA